MHWSRGWGLAAGLVAVLAVAAVHAAWQDVVRPKMFVQIGAEDVFRFAGNTTSIDYFRLIVRDGNSLLVGGRNLVYNLSTTDLTENQRLIWYSPEDAVKMCVVKGKDEDNCQNYIRILAVMSPGKLLVCGTNSFKPICREYSVQTGSYTLEKEKPGQAMCPYDPHHNSTAVFVGCKSRTHRGQ